MHSSFFPARFPIHHRPTPSPPFPSLFSGIHFSGTSFRGSYGFFPRCSRLFALCIHSVLALLWREEKTHLVALYRLPFRRIFTSDGLLTSTFAPPHNNAPNLRLPTLHGFVWAPLSCFAMPTTYMYLRGMPCPFFCHQIEFISHQLIAAPCLRTNHCPAPFDGLPAYVRFHTSRTPPRNPWLAWLHLLPACRSFFCQPSAASFTPFFLCRNAILRQLFLTGHLTNVASLFPQSPLTPLNCRGNPSL